MFAFECSGCTATIKVPYEAAGRRARCSRCKTPMVIPQPPLVAASSEAAPRPSKAAREFIPDRAGPSRVETRRVARCQRCDHMFRIHEDFVGCIECDVCGTEVIVDQTRGTRRFEAPSYEPTPPAYTPPSFEPPSRIEAPSPSPYGAPRGLPRGGYTPPPEPEVDDAVPAELTRGFGEVLGAATGSFFKNFAGLTGFAFASNLIYYGVTAAVGFGLMVMSGGLAMMGVPGIGTIALLFFLSIMASTFLGSVYLVLQAGQSRIALGYLCEPGRTRWTDGFGEIVQIGTAFKITFIAAFVGACLVFGGALPGLLAGSKPLLFGGIIASLVIMAWLGLRYMPLLSNEMVFRRGRGAFETLSGHAEAVRGNTLRVIGLLLLHLIAFTMIGLPGNIVSKLIVAELGLGGLILTSAGSMFAFSVLGGFFSALYSATYLSCRFRRR